MAFTGYQIFPGLTTIGIVNPAVQELATVFNLEGLRALQMPVDEDLKWAEELSGVTPAVFRGKVPIDFTALDGFEPYKGVRTFKQIDVAALQVDVNQWQRNIEFDQRLLMSGQQLAEIYNLAGIAQAIVQHSRVMRARLMATLFMQGVGASAKATVYAGNTIPGAGLPLFSRAATTGGHYANPLDANSRKFDNYFPGFGAFSPTTFGSMRAKMRSVPSPALSAETLGLQVTDVIGPSFMEEKFRQVQMATLTMNTLTVGGNGVAAAPTNIYAAGLTNWRYWIAPQLDADPYITNNAGKDLWFAVSRKLPMARCCEMAAPTKEFTPKLQLFGDGTELAAQTGKVHLFGSLDAGAAPGLPHVVQRYEEV